ncbi:MAG: glutaredoxin 3 [Thiohalomonadales bacterium]
MPNVIMYSTATCPYCFRAKILLKNKNIEFEEIFVDGNPELRQIMANKSSGISSVPQIFIDEHHVGGCDELYALEAQGKLDPILGLSAA